MKETLQEMCVITAYTAPTPMDGYMDTVKNAMTLDNFMRNIPIHNFLFIRAFYAHVMDFVCQDTTGETVRDKLLVLIRTAIDSLNYALHILDDDETEQPQHLSDEVIFVFDIIRDHGDAILSGHLEQLTELLK